MKNNLFKRKKILNTLLIIAVMILSIVAVHLAIREMNTEFDKYALRECPKQDWKGTIRMNVTDWTREATGEAIIDCPKFEENNEIYQDALLDVEKIINKLSGFEEE